MECLKDLIGITQSDCDCPEIGALHKVSLSGYYFDKTAYSYDMRQWVEMFGCENVGVKINSFIENAHDILVRELSMAINERYEVLSDPVSVSFGKSASKTKTFSAGDQLRFMFSSIARGKGAMFNASIIDSNFPIGSVSISQTNNISNEGRNHIEVVVDVLQDIEIMNTRNDCGTCSGSTAKNNGFTINVYSNNNLVTKQLLGFKFELSVSCSIDSMICRLMESATSIKSLGAIVQKISIREGLKYIKNSYEFDRYTVMNVDVREDDIHKLKAEYLRDINSWLIPMLQLDKSICYPCGSEKNVIKKTWF